MRRVLVTAALVVAFFLAFLTPLWIVAAAHVPGCHSRACDRRVHAARAWRWCKAHERCIWRKRFERLSYGWQQWAHRTSWCEASHVASTNTGNGYYGAFQMDLTFAANAGFTRRPDLTTWWEQAVRSIHHAQKHGTGAWPVCG